MQKVIKFFISSTFKDFENERNILQKFIFPKLKYLCQKNGFSFQPIDLRWGIQEEAGYDQQTMNICLNEIERSSYNPSPNLLLLVGQRYGWVPIPYEINTNEFNQILSSEDINYEEKDYVKKWYLEDKNSLPTSKYYLKDKYEYKDNRDAWSEIENKIRTVLQKVFNNPKDETTYRKYNTSATEQEMYAGLDAFDVTKKHDHTFAYFRTIAEKRTVNEELEDFIDKDLSKLNNLTKKLKNECNIPTSNQICMKIAWNDIKVTKTIPYENLTLEKLPVSLKEFHNEILKRFEIFIQKEIDNFIEQTELQIELEQQKIFLDTKSSLVVGREQEVDSIKEFILKDENKYYLQYGRSGTGKTSVMAKVISEVDTTKYEVIYRFVGTSAFSTFSRQLFENIYWQMESVLQKDNEILKPINEHEEDKFQKQFISKLTEYQKFHNKAIVLFIDAVDQFEDKSDLRILLENLPSNVKVVFSCLYDKTKKENEDYYWYYDILNDIQQKYQLTSLSKENESHFEILINLLKTWLENVNRKISKTQIESIKNNIDENTTPLYMKLVFELVRHWKDDEKDTHLEKDEKELIIQYFNMIQEKYHHEDILIKDALGYISASKDGLSEDELLDLFSRDSNVLKEYQNDRYPKLDKLPTAIWSRFYYYIEDLFTEKLIDGKMLINPYHRVVEEAIKENFYTYRNEELHSKLSEYFEINKIYNNGVYDLRKINEYPFHLIKIKNTKKLVTLIETLDYIKFYVENDSLTIYTKENNKYIAYQNNLEYQLNFIMSSEFIDISKILMSILKKIEENKKNNFSNYFAIIINTLNEENKKFVFEYDSLDFFKYYKIENWLDEIEYITNISKVYVLENKCDKAIKVIEELLNKFKGTQFINLNSTFLLKLEYGILYQLVSIYATCNSIKYYYQIFNYFSEVIKLAESLYGKNSKELKSNIKEFEDFVFEHADGIFENNLSIINKAIKNNNDTFIAFHLSNGLLNPDITWQISAEEFTSPLHIAINNNSKNTVELLIHYNSDVNLSYSNSIHTILERPISLSILNDYKEITKLLVEGGADINIEYPPGSDMNLFHYLLKNQNHEMINLLLKNKVDINQKFQWGYTILMRAIEENDIFSIKTLLENNVNINIKNDDDKTCLDLIKDRVNNINTCQEDRYLNEILNLFNTYHSKNEKVLFLYKTFENKFKNINYYNEPIETLFYLANGLRIPGLDDTITKDIFINALNYVELEESFCEELKNVFDCLFQDLDIKYGADKYIYKIGQLKFDYNIADKLNKLQNKFADQKILKIRTIA